MVLEIKFEMKTIFLLPSLMVLGQVFAAPQPENVSFVDHCVAADKVEKVDFSKADKQGKKFEREGVKKAKTSIPQLGKDLASPFTDPILKARAIYTWLHHYVQFDAVPNSTRITPELVIIKGIGVSKDYAKLFEELARGAGLDVMYIEGHGKGPGYKQPPPGGPLPPFESNHAWNAVKVDGKWQPIDPSYGALVVKIPEKKYAQRFNSKHFESTPDVFRLTHFPEKPEHQFCSDVVSWKDYIWPPVPPAPPRKPFILEEFKEIGMDGKDVTPNVSILRPGAPMRFTVKSLCDKPPIKKEDQYLLFVIEEGTRTHLKMEVEGRVWSGVTPPLDAGRVKLSYVNTLDGRSAKGLSLEEFEKGFKAKKDTDFKTVVRWMVEDPDDPDADLKYMEEPTILTNSNDSEVIDFTCIDYTEADAQALKFPLGTIKTISELAKALTTPFTSQILKARAIFTWITHNDIRVRTENFVGKSSEKVLKTGIGVCQGYARLFQDLALRSGLEVLFIRGAAKGFSYTKPINGVVPAFKTNHDWNAVKLNGRWKLIDSTWGAGKKFVNNKITEGELKFNPKYFIASPEVFQRTHYPDKPELQFASRIMSWEEWNLQEKPAEGPWITGKNDAGLNLQEVQPNIKRIPVGKPERFEVKCRCPIKKEEQYLVFIIANKGATLPLEVGEDGCLWSTVLTLLEPQQVYLAYVYGFGNGSAKGLTMKEFKAGSAQPGTYIATSHLARWEVYKTDANDADAKD